MNEFEKVVIKNKPKEKGKKKYCICPECKGLISIHTHEFDKQYYAICWGCGLKIKGGRT